VDRVTEDAQAIHAQLKSTTAVGLPIAAKALGIGMTLAYNQARTGHLGPVRVIKVGTRIVVPTAELREVLGIEG
jgi:hypothetical protein